MKPKLMLFLLLLTICSSSFADPLTNYPGQANATSENAEQPHLMFTRHPALSDSVNASAEYNRTVSIAVNAQIVVVDDIKVFLKDNETKLSYINITIPTSVQKDVLRAQVFVDYLTFTDIEISNTSKRDFSVFEGKEASTYFIDVRNETVAVNRTISDEIYIRMRLQITDHIHAYGFKGEQRSETILPVRGLLSNIPTTTNAEMRLLSTNDRFSSEIKGSYDLNGTSLKYSALFSEGFNPDNGLEENVDYVNAIFDSFPPDSFDNSPLAVVPYKYTNVERVVSIDPYGWIYVKETQSIKHLGAPRPTESNESYRQVYGFAGVIITVPASAIITDVYDEEGKLVHESGKRNETTNYPVTAEEDDFETLQVVFRNPAFGGEVYTFSVEYMFRSNTVLSKIEGRELVYNTTLSSNLNATVDNFKAVYKLPTGAKFVSHTYDSNSRSANFDYALQVNRNTLELFRHIELVYTGENITELDVASFQIYFNYSPAWLLLPIANYSLIVFTMLMAYAFYAVKYKSSRRQRTVEGFEEKIPKKELESYLKVFTEYMGTHESIEKLKRQKLSKTKYEAARKTIDIKLKQIQKDLDASVRQTRNIPQKYRSMVEDINVSYNTLLTARRNLAVNLRDYRRERITKDVYEAQKLNYESEIDRLFSKVERRLSEIEELIS